MDKVQSCLVIIFFTCFQWNILELITTALHDFCRIEICRKSVSSSSIKGKYCCVFSDGYTQKQARTRPSPYSCPWYHGKV